MKAPPSLPAGYHWLRLGSKLNHGDIEWESFKGRCGWRGQTYVGAWHIAEDQWTNRPSFYARPDDRNLLKKLPRCSACGRAKKQQSYGYGSVAEATILLHDNGGSLVCGGCLGSVTRHYRAIRNLGGVPQINGRPCLLREAQVQLTP